MWEPEARRPWWRRKRWAGAAVVLWLVAIYPVSPAPVAYLYGRGWLSSGAFEGIDAAFVPLAAGLSVIPGTIGGESVVGWWRTWNGSWFELGQRHAAEEHEARGEG